MKEQEFSLPDDPTLYKFALFFALIFAVFATVENWYKENVKVYCYNKQTKMGRHLNAEGLKNSRIQKEQLQLCKVQKELEKILGKVNEAINELKVEELQLKAGAATALSETFRSSPPSVAVCSQEQPSTSSSSLSILQLPQRLAYDEVCRGSDYNGDNVQVDKIVINQQIIDLNMNVGKNGVEEEEDEEL